MNILTRFNPYLKDRRVWAALAVIVAVIAIVGYKFAKDDAASVDEDTRPLVVLTSVEELHGGSSLSLIGTVRAFSEARITSERAGRVTSVSVTLGQTIRAGQTVATLENSAEAAAVLQAEGAYEAALASAAQSNVGVSEAETGLQNAKNSAVSTYRSAYNTVNNTITTSIDPFFSNPHATIPGLKIDGAGYTQTLNNERVAFQDLLQTWQNRSNSINANSDLQSELSYAKKQVERTIAMVDMFISIFNQPGAVGGYSQTERQTYSSNFSALRASLIGTRTSIDAALSGISSAEDAVRRAELASSGGQVSAADAQVKQALGALRAAQANYAKTVLRSPISGTVNTIDIKTGDFVNGFQEIARVANNNALEITTYVGDNERELLEVGDPVTVNGTYEGTITEIAPAVNPETRKIEVRIAIESENIKNGDTVTITKEISTAKSGSVSVPLSAVKFDADNGMIFMVENGHLITRSVKLGTIRGNTVEITEGLGMDEKFVSDARGLTEGTEVEVKQ